MNVSQNDAETDTSCEHVDGEYRLSLWQQINFVWRMFRDFIREA